MVDNISFLILYIILYYIIFFLLIRVSRQFECTSTNHTGLEVNDHVSFQ
jgi:preprotein translocase subunit YajC